uniref:Uncharacterized protein n=1 Tax=Rhizophora mucronata TaxID=61149 RepID=A0A2P2QVP0_RHIMU
MNHDSEFLTTLTCFLLELCAICITTTWMSNCITMHILF